jgi:hypothetical protein
VLASKGSLLRPSKALIGVLYNLPSVKSGVSSSLGSGVVVSSRCYPLESSSTVLSLLVQLLANLRQFSLLSALYLLLWS